MKRLPFLTLALTALSVLIHLAPSSINEWLESTRLHLASGDLWRLITSHFTHFSTEHFIWDTLTLLALGSLAERHSRRSLAITLLLSAPLIVIAVHLVQPHFTAYRGLSGIDCALYGLVAGNLLADGLKARHRFSILIGVIATCGLLAKCGYETIVGQTFFVNPADAAIHAYEPVPLAHLVGGLIGLACALFPLLKIGKPADATIARNDAPDHVPTPPVTARPLQARG